MKFTAAAVSLALLLPSFVSAATVPDFANKRFGASGNKQTGNSKANNNNKGGAAASSANTGGAAAAAASTASAAAAGSNTDAQSSLTLNPAVIATGFEQDGQANATAGQVPSATSSNNFINFCLLHPNLPITNGQQIKTGSCNPMPMGVIAATTNMPSSKFVSPPNGGTIPANTAFTITMALNHLQAGNFVNAATNYYSAPQTVNSAGDIVGHTHVVVEKLSALDQTTPTDPNTFAFFKGIDGAQVGGVVSADVTAGLPAGVYRLASINTAANHQPAVVAVAQHGSLDDMVYFTVSDGAAAAGSAAAGSAAATAANTASSAAAANNAGSSAAAATAGKNAGSAAAATAAGTAGNAAATAKSANNGKAANNGNKGFGFGKNGGRVRRFVKEAY